MADRSCITFANEEPQSESDNSSLFSSSLPHFSTRSSHLFNKLHQKNEHCLSNGKSRVLSILSPLVEFSSSFSSLCHFSLTRLHFPSLPSLISSMDDHLSEILYKFLSSPASHRTSLFILSPSGTKGNGLVGAVEERSPLMAAWFPLAFRKIHNPQYSAFSYNMDKLLTTRDIRETLVQVARGRTEGTVVRLDPDRRQSETASLLSEQLPEFRNCTMVNVPEENCLCMGMEERRSGSIDQERSLFHRVFDLLTSRLLQQSCLQSTEIRKEDQLVESHRLHSSVYGEEANEIEWLTIRFYGKLAEGVEAASPFITIEGTVRHYISSSRLEYVDAIVLNAIECLTLKVERMCEMCYSKGPPIISMDGPSHGFLMDISTEPS